MAKLRRLPSADGESSDSQRGPAFVVIRKRDLPHSCAKLHPMIGLGRVHGDEVRCYRVAQPSISMSGRGICLERDYRRLYGQDSGSVVVLTEV